MIDRMHLRNAVIRMYNNAMGSSEGGTPLMLISKAW